MQRLSARGEEPRQGEEPSVGEVGEVRSGFNDRSDGRRGGVRGIRQRQPCLSFFISFFQDVIRERNEAAGINLPIPAIRMIGGSRPQRGLIATASSLSQHFGKVRRNKESSEVATGGEA